VLTAIKHIVKNVSHVRVGMTTQRKCCKSLS